MDDKWKRKVDALILLAKDQKGKPEGDVAQAKLQAILDKHPVESAKYEPFRDFIFTTSDFVRARQAGIDMMGKWAGGTLQEAIQKMVLDLAQRSMQEEERAFLYGKPKFNTMDPLVNALSQMAEGEERTIPMYGRSPLQDQIYEVLAKGVEGDPCQTCDEPWPEPCDDCPHVEDEEDPQGE